MSDPLPALRRDLQAIARLERGRATYLFEHPESGAVVELGEREHFLCQQLDGATDAGEIARRYHRRFGASLGRRAVEALVRQLARQDLLEGDVGALRQRTIPEWLDPEELMVVKRFCWRGADRVLGRLSHASGLLFGPPAGWLGAALVLWALRIVYVRGDELLGAIGWRWGYAFFLGLVLPSCLLVRSVRSLVHALKTKRAGRNVSQAGLALLYYVLPFFYCDWSSDLVWVRGRARRARMVLVGLYSQLVLWAVGAVSWHLTTPGTLANEIWLAFMLSAALTLVLLSANPLVMMEGYALLINWLGVPRLRERALAMFGALVSCGPSPEAMSLGPRLLFALYGGLTFLYAVVMVAVHLWLSWLWLTDAFEGTGALLTVAIALYMLQRPILAWLRRRRFVRLLLGQGASPLVWTARGAVAAALALIGLMPCHYDTGGPFTILPQREHEIHTEFDGMVAEVLVREGESVTAGQPVARLRQPDPATALEMARSRLRATRAEIRLLEAGARPEAVERAESTVRIAQAKVSWSAPLAGRYAELYHESAVSAQERETALWLRDADEAELEETRAGLALVRSPARSQQIEALEARARRYEAQIADYQEQTLLLTLRSPIDGVVVTPRVSDAVGRVLEAGDLLATVAETRSVRTEISVPEATIAEVVLGAPVRIAAWATADRHLVGRVAAIAPVGERSGEGTIVRVIAEFPNAGGLLRPRMTGYAKITSAPRPLFRVVLAPVARFVRVRLWSWIP